MPVYKIANKSALHTYQILPSSNRLNLFLLSFTHVLKKIETTMRWKKSASFSTNNGRTSRLSSFYRIIVNHKNFILKYLDNTFKFLLNFTNIEAATGGKSTSERFWKNSSKRREIRLLIRLRLLCRTNVFLNLKYFWWKSYGNHNRKSIFYRASAFKWSYWSFYWFRSCLLVCFFLLMGMWTSKQNSLHHFIWILNLEKRFWSSLIFSGFLRNSSFWEHHIRICKKNQL